MLIFGGDRYILINVVVYPIYIYFWVLKHHVCICICIPIPCAALKQCFEYGWWQLMTLYSIRISIWMCGLVWSLVFSADAAVFQERDGLQHVVLGGDPDILILILPKKTGIIHHYYHSIHIRSNSNTAFVLRINHSKLLYLHLHELWYSPDTDSFIPEIFQGTSNLRRQPLCSILSRSWNSQKDQVRKPPMRISKNCWKFFILSCLHMKMFQCPIPSRNIGFLIFLRHVMTCIIHYLENKVLLIFINFTYPQNQPQLPKKMVLSYVFKVDFFCTFQHPSIPSNHFKSIHPWGSPILKRWQFQPKTHRKKRKKRSKTEP